MERPVKERLIGAAVLVAAAVILIPEMLSGPDRHEREAEPQPMARTNDAPMKTYTIDLTRSPGTQQLPSETLETRAPPPEETSVPSAAAAATVEPTDEPVAPAQPSPEPNVERISPDAAASAPATQPAVPEPLAAEKPSQGSAPEPAETRAQPKRAAPEPPTPAPQSSPVTSTPTQRALASAPSAPRSGGWAVQLGSFSKQESAERLAKQVREKGYDAFVMPVKSGSSTLYRVRVGPMQDRASAETTLGRVKATVPAAAVVAHP